MEMVNSENLFTESGSSPPRKPDCTRWLTVKEAAVYLRRTEGAVRHLVNRREVPFVKKPRRVFFDRKALDRWMQRDAVEAA